MASHMTPAELEQPAIHAMCRAGIDVNAVDIQVGESSLTITNLPNSGGIYGDLNRLARMHGLDKESQSRPDNETYVFNFA